MGGAVALLLGISLARRWSQREVTVWMFGAPRVGDQSLADLVESIPLLLVWRVENRNDPVPFLPFVGGYRPVGRKREIAALHPWYKPISNHSIKAYMQAARHEAVAAHPL